MARLEKKVAVITGAASGIGRSTAIRFAGEGATVVIADLNRDGGEATVRECRENGGNAVWSFFPLRRIKQNKLLDVPQLVQELFDGKPGPNRFCLLMHVLQ